jgi:hypothetical protein
METEKKLLESPERFANRDILRIIGELLGRELETDELDDCLTTIGFTWDQVAELEDKICQRYNVDIRITSHMTPNDIIDVLLSAQNQTEDNPDDSLVDILRSKFRETLATPKERDGFCVKKILKQPQLLNDLLFFRVKRFGDLLQKIRL